ncbi:MAG: CD3324 family protein [Oscillospiraceae bacterium]|nr:CD3324 family protein [Oscillospiraceae bacterium]
MRNSNIEEVLPKELLFEVQQYVQGKSLYIPKIKDSYKQWGDTTKSKIITSVRNDKIRLAFREGSTIDELCVQYSLSQESIKKIVYVKS